MRVAVAGLGEMDRVHEALDTVHGMHPITLMGVRDTDSPAAVWARRRGVPTTEYIPPAVIDLGIVLPGTEDAWHARMLLDNVPCLEIHP